MLNNIKCKKADEFILETKQLRLKMLSDLYARALHNARVQYNA